MPLRLALPTTHEQWRQEPIAISVKKLSAIRLLNYRWVSNDINDILTSRVVAKTDERVRVQLMDVCRETFYRRMRVENATRLLSPSPPWYRRGSAVRRSSPCIKLGYCCRFTAYFCYTCCAWQVSKFLSYVLWLRAAAKFLSIISDSLQQFVAYSCSPSETFEPRLLLSFFYRKIKGFDPFTLFIDTVKF